MNWKYYEQDEMYSEILIYWYQEWISISNEIKRGSIGIEIINIRSILSDIINEYELNNFKSNNNKRIYIKLINSFLKESHLKKYRAHLNILKEKLEKSKYDAVYIIAKDIQKELIDENFNQILFDEILTILESKKLNANNRSLISDLTKQIIIDLVSLGRNIKNIKKLLINTFQNYFKIDGLTKIVYGNLPTDFTDLEPEEYIIESKKYIDDLTIDDRLKDFKQSLITEKSEYTIVFPIWGASSKLQEEVSILDGYLYSPQTKLFFEENDLLFDEYFKISDIEESKEETKTYNRESHLNAKISVISTSKENASKLAILKYKQILSLINYKYTDNRLEYFWDGQFLGRNQKDKLTFSSISLNKDIENRLQKQQISKSSPKNLSKSEIKDISNISNIFINLEKANLHFEANTLKNVISLLTETQWLASEDQLLNYWIVIESLVNISIKPSESSFNFAKEIISNMYFLTYIYTPIHNLFSTIDYYSSKKFQKDDEIKLPQDYLEEIGINKISEDGKTSLKPLYSSLNVLRSHITKEQFLNEIDKTTEFYNNNATILTKLKKKRENVNLTLDYIYKTRNQIVHNGYIDRNIIPYLVLFAEGYAKSLLEDILNAYDKDVNIDLHNYFAKKIYEGELLEKRLDDGTLDVSGEFFD